VDALNQQGLALAEAGQFRGAVTLFRRATVLDPAHVGVRQNLATALLDSDDLVAAEKEAAAAIVIDPSDASLYELLGRALALQRKTPEAIAQLEHALRLAPGDEHIKDDLRRVIAESR
jgi:superkiller protein 3